jgi:hypothetical protein
MALTAAVIADRIEQLKAYYTSTSLFLMLLAQPWFAALLEGPLGLDQGSNIQLGRHDNSYYEGLDVHAAVARTTDSTAFNLDFVGLVANIAVTTIGDDLAANRYFDHAPMLELFRHLRNALAPATDGIS